MKKHVLILGLIMSVIFCNGQTHTIKTKTMLEEFNLKGKVKTLAYEYETGSHKLFFDESGMLVRQENVYNGTKYMETHDNYLYAEGRLQSFDVFRVFDEIPTLFLGKALFEYDSRGLLISSDFSYIHNDRTVYRYDEKGNRIEWHGLLKTRQKFDAEGLVAEQWYFDDRESEVREFGVMDAQGNPLPDEVLMLPPYELPPTKYLHNRLGDVVSITNMAYTPPVTDTVTLTYDSAGNWTERTINGNRHSYHYLTAEYIYTHEFPYSKQYIHRKTEYYE